LDTLLSFSLTRYPPRSTLFPTRRSSDLESRIALMDASAFGVQRIGDTGSLIVAGTTVGIPLLPRIDQPFSSSSAMMVRVTPLTPDRKSTRLNSSHRTISYAVFCLKKKTH